jgi:NADPH:quinone reductase-like Zn-dependent oxidoreductase
MRYINISEYGGPEVMEIKEGKTPDPNKGEVLIKEHAAGENRPDIRQRQGLYPPPPGASPILGLEVGGDYVTRNLELAARDGRIVSISFIKGSRVEIDMMHILLKRLIITGSTLRPRSTEAKAGIAQKLRTQIWPLIESGEIKPLIAARFPLEDVAESHKLMESSKHIGKIILTVAD